MSISELNFRERNIYYLFVKPNVRQEILWRAMIDLVPHRTDLREERLARFESYEKIQQSLHLYDQSLGYSFINLYERVSNFVKRKEGTFKLGYSENDK